MCMLGHEDKSDAGNDSWGVGEFEAFSLNHTVTTVRLFIVFKLK